MESGHLHPLTILKRQIIDIFHNLGFEVPDGPEVESELNNFDALNIPSDHPARDMWDTFWLKPKEDGRLLRTHTSPVQIRYMKTHEPPIALGYIGKTYRQEATDATHEAVFHQVEGLLVGENISLSHLKGTLEQFLKLLFKTNMSVRFRPSFFPFVEPGLEVDVSCFKCEGKGCTLCKNVGWIELLGAGMVHPKVLSNCGINPRKYQGFAFGMGLERLAMLLYGIDDVRLFQSGDLRLTRQFETKDEN
jgi:phenylalanyl-tRNA synthetase alpha chain